MSEFREIEGGKLRINFHSGQTKVWESKRRVVAMLAGSQSGKTVFGPHWLEREIRERGVGDYLIGTSTYPLLSRKLLPEFLYVFQDLYRYGVYNSYEKVFTFYTKGSVKREGVVLFPESDRVTRVLIGSAQNPESMESATVKGVWLDECVAPETIIDTEFGRFPIREIVEKRLHLKVWSYDTLLDKWGLKPIFRWIKLPQRKPLLRLGDLRLTGNHKVWTKDGYILTDDLITSANYAILKAEVIKDEKGRVQTFRRDSQEDEGIRQKENGGTRCEGFRQSKEALSRASRTQSGYSRTSTAEIYQPSESPLGTNRWGAFIPSVSCQTDCLNESQEVANMGRWRQRQTDKLETGAVGCGIGVGERVCGDNRKRMVASRLQDRCGGTRVKDSDRSGECCQSTQDRMVRTKWVGISSLLKSHGGSLDGGSSSDSYVYNLEVEDNHNYIADNILVSNCGQKQFKRETWEAIQRRTLIEKARVLLTTTVYGLGWLKTDIYDRWLLGDREIDVIQFDSMENPSFPLDEYKRMKDSMPEWKFDMFHRGRFSKPAGLIYNAFDSARDIIEPFEINPDWPRYVGHDFGPVHTVALWMAFDPSTGTFYIYRDYAVSGLSTFEHVSNWIELSKGERIAQRVGGSAVEDGWRGDFTQAGWRIDKPLDRDVESGITRVYGFEKLGKKKVFRTCQNYLHEKQTYSRELDDMYNPTNKIENKDIYHFMDAERYLFSLFQVLSTSYSGRQVAPVGRRV